MNTRRRSILAVGMWIAGCTSPSSSPSPVTASPRPAVTLTAAVRAFTVIELQSGPANWAYAPQVQLAETSGRTGLTVTRMDFSFPGLGPGPACVASKRVEAGETKDLLGFGVYDDYEITYDQPGVRATGGEATVTLTIVEDDGRTGTITARGVITSTPASPPGARPFDHPCQAPVGR